MISMAEGELETWNMAMETMKRLSLLLNLCTTSFQDGNMIDLYNYLCNLKRNLAPFLDDKEFEELNNLFQKLPQGWSSKKNPNGTIPKYYNQVYSIFDEVYIFCGRQMKKKGILMPEGINKNRAILGM